jgi:hypothetical protein
VTQTATSRRWSTRHRLRTGYDVPDSVFAAYGRRPDPLAAAVYNGFLHLRERPEDAPVVVQRMRDVLSRSR